MSITTKQIYDANRDLYIEQERYEREMQLMRMKEQDYLRQQQQQQSMYGQAIFGQSAHHQGGMLSQAKNQVTPDPKDPLAFLNKSDSKLLLTGEAL